MWMHYEKELMGQGKDDTVMDVSTTSKLECWVLYGSYVDLVHKVLLIRKPEMLSEQEQLVFWV
jgi:hypothetical protein